MGMSAQHTCYTVPPNPKSIPQDGFCTVCLIREISWYTYPHISIYNCTLLILAIPRMSIAFRTTKDRLATNIGISIPGSIPQCNT